MIEIMLSQCYAKPGLVHTCRCRGKWVTWHDNDAGVH